VKSTIISGEKIVNVKFESTNQMTAAWRGGEHTRGSVDYLCVFQLSLCGCSCIFRAGRGRIIVEFFNYYFLYKLSDKSSVLGRYMKHYSTVLQIAIFLSSLIERVCWEGGVVYIYIVEEIFFVNICFIFRPKNVEPAQNSRLTFLFCWKEFCANIQGERHASGVVWLHDLGSDFDGFYKSTIENE
jgi:hypothetical protein